MTSAAPAPPAPSGHSFLPDVLSAPPLRRRRSTITAFLNSLSPSRNTSTPTSPTTSNEDLPAEEQHNSGSTRAKVQRSGSHSHAASPFSAQIGPTLGQGATIVRTPQDATMFMAQADSIAPMVAPLSPPREPPPSMAAVMAKHNHNPHDMPPPSAWHTTNPHDMPPPPSTLSRKPSHERAPKPTLSRQPSRDGAPAPWSATASRRTPSQGICVNSRPTSHTSDNSNGTEYLSPRPYSPTKPNPHSRSSGDSGLRLVFEQPTAESPSYSPGALSRSPSAPTHTPHRERVDSSNGYNPIRSLTARASVSTLQKSPSRQRVCPASPSSGTAHSGMGMGTFSLLGCSPGHSPTPSLRGHRSRPSLASQETLVSPSTPTPCVPILVSRTVRVGDTPATLVTLRFGYSLDAEPNTHSVTVTMDTLRPAGGEVVAFLERALRPDSGVFRSATPSTPGEVTDMSGSEESDFEFDNARLHPSLRRGKMLVQGQGQGREWHDAHESQAGALHSSEASSATPRKLVFSESERESEKSEGLRLELHHGSEQHEEPPRCETPVNRKPAMSPQPSPSGSAPPRPPRRQTGLPQLADLPAALAKAKAGAAAQAAQEVSPAELQQGKAVTSAPQRQSLKLIKALSQSKSSPNAKLAPYSESTQTQTPTSTSTSTPADMQSKPPRARAADPRRPRAATCPTAAHALITEITLLIPRDAGAWHAIAARLCAGQWPSLDGKRRRVEEECKWAGMGGLLEELRVRGRGGGYV